MLRIHVEETQNPDRVTLRLEGKLIQPWVHELGKTWLALIQSSPWPPSIRADLNAVSYVDEDGMALLTSLYLAGCELVGSGPFITAAIEECVTVRASWPCERGLPTETSPLAARC
jgi:ABC-type transporter Mla MlaB component